MRNILLATDFSSNAYAAALFAAELCRRKGGRLIIFHALSPISMLKEDEEGPCVHAPEEVAQKELDMLAYKLHSRFGVSVSRLMKPGFAEDEIPVLAEELPVDLIVLGKQGGALVPDKDLGRVSNAVLKASCLPVICVPAEADLDFPRQASLMLNREAQLCNRAGLALLADLNSQFPTESPKQA